MAAEAQALRPSSVAFPSAFADSWILHGILALQAVTSCSVTTPYPAKALLLCKETMFGVPGVKMWYFGGLVLSAMSLQPSSPTPSPGLGSSLGAPQLRSDRGSPRAGGLGLSTAGW